MTRRLGSKGLAIAQVLVMAVLLALMSVMMLRWALGRHIVANKVIQQAKTRSIGQAALSRALAKWNGAAPASFTETIDGKSVSVSVSGPDADGQYTVTINAPE